jgi:hypothetical protein
MIKRELDINGENDSAAYLLVGEADMRNCVPGGTRHVFDGCFGGWEMA